MVYLDPWIDWGKRIGRAGPKWSHLIADTEEELHQMAQRIGLKRAWFQAGRRPHYDIGTLRIRNLAIQMGAVECDLPTFGGHMKRIFRSK